jgi:hypothetical protein
MVYLSGVKQKIEISLIFCKKFEILIVTIMFRLDLYQWWFRRLLSHFRISAS